MMRQDPDVWFGELRDASALIWRWSYLKRVICVGNPARERQQDVEHHDHRTLNFLMLLQVLHNHQNGLSYGVDLRTSPWSSLAK